jgi:PRC-barrel domain
MKIAHLIVLAALAIAAPAISYAQVAGSTFVSATYAELRDVAVGWSAKRQILGHPVYNDANERVGSIDDVIVTPDKSVSYAIIMPAASSPSRSTMSPCRCRNSS